MNDATRTRPETALNAGERPVGVAGLVSKRAAERGLRMGFGGDYNPEQWPGDVWAEDVELMQAAGVTFATVGVFSWARLQPTAAPEFEFGWLDQVLDLLHGKDIAVDLATATASPPAWLAHLHPEMLPVDVFGNRLSYGSRQAWCPSSPVYRQASLLLVEAMAERYKDHPSLSMWHVSNELGCHNAYCYCDVSAASFRGWLADRYGDLDALNSAWGTDFWSQRYGEWAHVLPPRATTAQMNPTQQLDFKRFCSAELLGQHRAERAVLDAVSPGVPVTTNFMVTSHIDALDYWKWAPEQDVISQDHYLDGRMSDPHVELSLCADWTRGLANGEPWILMEHSTSAVNWQPRNFAKTPHQMLRNSLQHVARGADSVGFFQWRASRAGAEKYHSAMLPHAGTETRVWREVCELGAALGNLAEVEGSHVVADAAMVLDYESLWAVQRGSLPTTDLGYVATALSLYRALWDAQVSVDVVAPGAALGQYQVVLAPMLHLLSDSDAENLDAYVRDGGRLLTTYFSGVIDDCDHVRLGGYPGALRETLGIWIEEFHPLDFAGPRSQVKVVDVRGQPVGVCHTWLDDLQLRGAEAVLLGEGGPLSGVPVLTRHSRGAGVAWYLATQPDAETMAHIVGVVLDEAGVAGAGLPAGVEVVQRSNGEHTYTFVLNHTAADVRLEFYGTDLLAANVHTSTEHTEPWLLGAGAVACVRSSTARNRGADTSEVLDAAAERS